ncbi:MAG: hypothetical protein Harvfovirus22_17 [Harvfovirus sp.]|uniref:Uncharacterized protein n=1 Tax=Harvfovirus sp. TaxID=2487768 RepID=A0A3G5A220_9VIRU|nr:MAG: hypothetical protein Harvfovirus22_17 [Harvfovirus sp.]
MATTVAWIFCTNIRVEGSFLCPVYKSELSNEKTLCIYGFLHKKFIDFVSIMTSYLREKRKKTKNYHDVIFREESPIKLVIDTSICIIGRGSSPLSNALRNCGVCHTPPRKKLITYSASEVWNNIYDVLFNHLYSDENKLSIDDLDFVVQLIWTTNDYGNRLNECDLKLQQHRKKENREQIRNISYALLKHCKINWSSLVKIINEYLDFGYDFFPMWDNICGDYYKYNRSVQLITQFIKIKRRIG